VLDVLDTEGGSASPRRRALLVAVVAVAALVFVGARWESERQLDALLTAATDTEAVVHDSRRSLGGMVAYTGALLSRSDLEPAQRAAVLDSFAVDAGRFPPRVEEPRAALERVRPLPWDGDLAAARDAYLERIDAWTRFVSEAQDSPDTLLLERRATRPAREAAAEAVQDAADGRRAEQVAALSEALLGR
jgi:hypothetical protein